MVLRLTGESASIKAILISFLSDPIGVTPTFAPALRFCARLGQGVLRLIGVPD
jgi:hypothetical protein